MLHQLTTLSSASVASTPIPGGPHGGTPAACHESKAMVLEKSGDASGAAKERQAASEARKGHYQKGGHKKRETDMCIEAKAVQLQNHGDPSGAAAARAKINKAQLQKESQVADSTAVKNHQKEGWKGS
jgi:hypothetical protein